MMHYELFITFVIEIKRENSYINNLNSLKHYEENIPFIRCCSYGCNDGIMWW